MFDNHKDVLYFQTQRRFLHLSIIVHFHEILAIYAFLNNLSFSLFFKLIFKFKSLFVTCLGRLFLV
nr:MAG TPA: hypothetical protein [Caudoviricetes sp.]